MGVKRKLNQVDLCYIEHYRDKMSVDQLAKVLGASKTVVREAVESLTTASAATQAKLPDIPAEKTSTGTPAPAAAPLHDKERGVTVLTPAAAQYADEVAKTLPQENYVERNRGKFIHTRQ